MPKNKESEMLIARYRANIAALEEREEYLIEEMELLKNIIPNVLMWCMSKVLQSSKNNPVPQQEIEQEAREKLESLQNALDEIEEALELLKEEKEVMKKRTEELEMILAGQKDQYPSEIISIDITIPDKPKFELLALNNEKEINHLTILSEGKKFQELFQVEDRDWKKMYENLLRQKIELDEKLKNSSRKLKETEDHVKCLEEGHRELEEKLQLKIKLLENKSEFSSEINGKGQVKSLQKLPRSIDALTSIQQAQTEEISMKNSPSKPPPQIKDDHTEPMNKVTDVIDSMSMHEGVTFIEKELKSHILVPSADQDVMKDRGIQSEEPASKEAKVKMTDSTNSVANPDTQISSEVSPSEAPVSETSCLFKIPKISDTSKVDPEIASIAAIVKNLGVQSEKRISVKSYNEVKCKEAEILIARYNANISSFEERKGDLKRQIELFENLIPTILVLYMSKVLQAIEIPFKGEKEFPEHKIMEEVKARLEHFKDVLTELEQALEIIEEEEDVMRNRIEELETFLGAQPCQCCDKIPDFSLSRPEKLHSFETLKTQPILKSDYIIPVHEVVNQENLPILNKNREMQNVDIAVWRKIPSPDMIHSKETSSKLLVGLGQTHVHEIDVSSETVHVHSETASVPSETARVPSETANVPSGTAIVPSETASVPSETARVPSETASVPSETASVPSGTARVPSETASVPSETASVPSETARVLSETKVKLVSNVNKEKGSPDLKVEASVDKNLRYEDLSQNKDTNWHLVCENLLKQISNLNENLENSTQKLRESEDYVRYLREEYSKLESKLRAKIELLKMKTGTLISEAIDREEGKYMQEEFESKEAISALREALEEVTSMRESLLAKSRALSKDDQPELLGKMANGQDEVSLLDITTTPKISVEPSATSGIIVFPSEKMELKEDTSELAREEKSKETGPTEIPRSVSEHISEVHAVQSHLTISEEPFPGSKIETETPEVSPISVETVSTIEAQIVEHERTYSKDAVLEPAELEMSRSEVISTSEISTSVTTGPLTLTELQAIQLETAGSKETISEPAETETPDSKVLTITDIVTVEPTTPEERLPTFLETRASKQDNSKQSETEMIESDIKSSSEIPPFSVDKLTSVEPQAVPFEKPASRDVISEPAEIEMPESEETPALKIFSDEPVAPAESQTVPVETSPSKEVTSEPAKIVMSEVTPTTEISPIKPETPTAPQPKPIDTIDSKSTISEPMKIKMPKSESPAVDVSPVELMSEEEHQTIPDETSASKEVTSETSEMSKAEITPTTELSPVEPVAEAQAIKLMTEVLKEPIYRPAETEMPESFTKPTPKISLVSGDQVALAENEDVRAETVTPTSVISVTPKTSERPSKHLATESHSFNSSEDPDLKEKISELDETKLTLPDTTQTHKLPAEHFTDEDPVLLPGAVVLKGTASDPATKIEIPLLQKQITPQIPTENLAFADVSYTQPQTKVPKPNVSQEVESDLPLHQDISTAEIPVTLTKNTLSQDNIPAMAFGISTATPKIPTESLSLTATKAGPDRGVPELEETKKSVPEKSVPPKIAQIPVHAGSTPGETNSEEKLGVLTQISPLLEPIKLEKPESHVAKTTVEGKPPEKGMVLTEPITSETAFSKTTVYTKVSDPGKTSPSGIVSKDVRSGVPVNEDSGLPIGRLSAISLTVETLQSKKRVKDHLIKEMADQLRQLLQTEVWDGWPALEAAVTARPATTYDWDRTTLLRYLRGEEPHNYAPSMSTKDPSISNPLNLKIVRKLDKDSLMIEWGPPPSSQVVGFQIFLNGQFKYWVHSSKRNLALLHPLDLKLMMEIAVSPVDVRGDIASRSTITYKPE